MNNVVSIAATVVMFLVIFTLKDSPPKPSKQDLSRLSRQIIEKEMAKQGVTFNYDPHTSGDQPSIVMSSDGNELDD